MLTDTVNPNARERGKADRRRRILDAARALISETGDTGLSMRALATRAELSITTPYNLFGSKTAILAEMLQQDFDELDAELRETRSKNELVRIFDFVSLTCRLFGRSPQYFRATMSEVFSLNNGYERVFGYDREHLWRELVLSARAGGYLHEDADPYAVAEALMFQYTTVMMAWIQNRLTLEEMEGRARFGFSMLLLGASSERGRDFLSGEFRQRQDEIKRLREDRRRAR